MHRYSAEKKREVWDEERRNTFREQHERIRPHLEHFADEERHHTEDGEKTQERSRYDLSDVFRSYQSRR
jgi:hypothetical protein